MGQVKNTRRLADNQAEAKLRNLRVSPRKLNLIAGTIRNLPVQDALVQLNFSRKAASREVKKLLESAIANAENNHNLDIDQLYVKEAIVGKALVMKRIQARARGRAFRIIKPFANIRIVVEEKAGE